GSTITHRPSRCTSATTCFAVCSGVRSNRRRASSPELRDRFRKAFVALPHTSNNCRKFSVSWGSRGRESLRMIGTQTFWSYAHPGKDSFYLLLRRSILRHDRVREAFQVVAYGKFPYPGPDRDHQSHSEQHIAQPPYRTE